jgi:hypothetical protein
LENRLKIAEGIALSLSLLLCSLYLYLNPDFIGQPIITRTVGAILGFIGIIGFLSELSKATDESLKKPINEIMASLIIGLVIFSLMYFFTNWFVNIIVIILAVVGLFGFLRGVAHILLLTWMPGGNNVIKLPVLLLNAAIFALTLLQILQIFKLI